MTRWTIFTTFTLGRISPRIMAKLSHDSDAKCIFGTVRLQCTISVYSKSRFYFDYYD